MRIPPSLRRDDAATKADLFTYPATLLRVIDGDTIVVALHVTLEVLLEEKRRLRGLDCPELNTPEGKAAKRFIDGLLTPGAAVILTTTKPDKYERYLADVATPNTAEPLFLNHALLAAGHARR